MKIRLEKNDPLLDDSSEVVSDRIEIGRDGLGPWDGHRAHSEQSFPHGGRHGVVCLSDSSVLSRQ